MTPSSHTESNELPSWANIGIYLFLLAILAVFGDLFVFIVGFLGLTVIFTSYFSGKSSHEEHH
ncbi:hypothetical protein GCM10027275_39880 [Rhabdobacter roseus]|uniref:Uncharacterized protein n=1 Tax=Rhabdobacter roseus TaxID=1655419 RepID=A0A840TS08_9BACT|nr:hypothetical protein [Rhabdobacter roseus]MBB5285695.1 hypothetical protein [Rhabdobacter roseus]